MSSFSGLNIGLTSLYAQRRGLELTGHNIANANTEGYSRQRLRLEADGGPLKGAVHSVWKGAGNGVEVAGSQRMRDAFLEARSLQERGTDSSLRGNQVLLSRVEAILTEPGTAGLQAQFSDFWQSWDDVAKDAAEPATRSALIESARTLASGLNQASDQINKQWDATHEQLRASVDEINAIAANVAEYNRAIVTATRGGLSPNDLTDQRDLLVQRLGQLTGATVRPAESGAVTVFVGGTALVRGNEAERMTVRGVEELTTPAGRVAIGWERDGANGPAAPVGGASGAMLKGLNDVMPRYRDGLDRIAVNLRDTVNGQHAKGFDLSGAPGGDFFGGGSAATLGVVVPGPSSIAASTAVGNGGDGDKGGTNAADMAELASSALGPDTAYRELIVGLGVEAQTANRRVSIQAEILSQIDAAVEAEAGVSLDEEMTNMLAYQRAYEGAARYMSAIDSMLDTLINRTGLVGR
jgi:flagellar hook-associated protein 1 FlgK